MGVLYVVTATAASPSNTAKTAIQLATGTTISNRIIAFDISFDGADATKTPIVVTLEKPTAASSGGSTFTPLTLGPDAVANASITTARVNDTTPGTGTAFGPYTEVSVFPAAAVGTGTARNGRVRICHKGHISAADAARLISSSVRVDEITVEATRSPLDSGMTAAQPVRSTMTRGAIESEVT